MTPNLIGSPPPGDLRTLVGPARDAGSRPPPGPPPVYPWKTRGLLPLGIVSAVVALLAYAGREALWPAVDVRVIPVVVKAGTESGTAGNATVQAAGWVEADPYPVAVPALTDGVVREVLVLEGEAVKAGQVVARLVDDDAELALARAEAELAQAEAERTAARREWENPVERTRAVDAARAAVAETRAEMRRLDSEVAAEAAKAEELADQLARATQSYEAQAATEQEVVSVRLRLKAQRGTLAAAEARRPVLSAQLRQREADLTAAERHLELRIAEGRELAAAEAAEAAARAARDEAELRLNRTHVRSPAGGIVLARMVGPGSKVMFGADHPDSATAVTLFDPARLAVRVDVPLADAAKVGVGTPARVVVGVLPDRTFDGVVTRVVQEADVAKNTLQVKVRIEEPAAELKPEMLARVLFTSTGTAGGTTTRPSQLTFAPESLLHRSGQATTTWVVDRRRGVAERREVVTGGVRQDGWVSVASGLNAGDLLIADASGLTDGTRVRVVGEADAVAGGADEGGGHGVH